MVDHLTYAAASATAEAAANPTVAAFRRAMVHSLVDRTRDYLTQEFGIDVAQTPVVRHNPDRLHFKDATTVIGIKGDFGVFIAFSFPEELVDVLYERLTTEIDVPNALKGLYRGDAIAETANVIIGNCTTRFSSADARVNMSAPVLLADVKSLPRPTNAVFDSVSLGTNYGSFDINLIGPCDAFDSHLNQVL